jgi:magnesium transporter
MIERFVNKGVTWLDVVHPTSDEIRTIFRECKLPASFADDLTSMTPRSEAKALNGAIKITLDFPIVKRTDITHPHEVKFIATKKHLVTVRFEDIQAVHRFTKEFEVLSLLKDKNKKEADGALLMIVMLSYLYQGLDEKLDYLESKTQDIEQGIQFDDEKDLLFEISAISRRIISFQHTISTHNQALKELANLLKANFGTVHEDKITQLIVSYQHLVHRAGSLLNSIRDLRQTNSDLLTAKQNEVMKIFTIMAFITFPLTLFTSMFGMNTEHTPLVSGQYGFWYILGIMTIISAGFFVYFRYKKWL